MPSNPIYTDGNGVPLAPSAVPNCPTCNYTTGSNICTIDNTWECVCSLADTCGVNGTCEVRGSGNPK